MKENFDPVGHLQFKVTSSEVAIKHLKELVITDLTVKKPSLFRRVWNYLNNKITKQEIHSLAQDKLEQRKDKLNKALMERGILIDLDNQASEASRPVSMQSKR